MPPKLNLSTFPKLEIKANDVAGSWRTFIRRFELEIEIKRRELGTHEINNVEVDVFDNESRLLALLKAIDLEGGDVLAAEGLNWGDGRITYDLALNALRRHYSREESVYVRTQKFVMVQQALGEDQRDYIKRVEKLSRNLDYFNNVNAAQHQALQVARESLTLSLTVNGLRDTALKRELMATPDLNWVRLGDILRTRTVAAESSYKLDNPKGVTPTPIPVVKTEPSDVIEAFEVDYVQSDCRPRESDRDSSYRYRDTHRPERQSSNSIRNYPDSNYLDNSNYDRRDRNYYSPNQNGHYASKDTSHRETLSSGSNSPRRSVHFSMSNSRPNSSERDIFCYQCGSRSHLVKDCPQTRCFKCSEFGHMASFCTKPLPSFCYQCDSRSHFVNKCPQTRCYRCQEYGHMASSCIMSKYRPIHPESWSNSQRSPSPFPDRGRADDPTHYIRAVKIK